ncbi:Peptidoglycan hydrolase FlgJ [subsurface metagenome]
MNAKQYLWCIKILRQAYKSKLITGLPASAVAAQAVLESGYGKSEPVDLLTGKRSYNLFGVKCSVKNGIIIVGGNNGCVLSYTHEEINGEKKLILARFRAYKTHKDSFNDHAKILGISKDDNGEQRYREAFNYLEDSEQFITEIWKAGYATDSNYVKNIIPIIRTLNRIPVWVLKL